VLARVASYTLVSARQTMSSGRGTIPRRAPVYPFNTMRITDLQLEHHGARVRSFAQIAWEERDAPASTLEFIVPRGPDAPSPEAFLLACFPLAAAQGERRITIAAPVCARLIEGLHAVHACWRNWGLVTGVMPRIEAQGRPRVTAEPPRALGFFSGGVDSLHMLLRNRALYERGDPSYIADALVIHGFDIGKRAYRLEHEHFALTLARLEEPAAAMDLRLLACSTNLRHLPTRPGDWSTLHHGAALAAVAHAATRGSAQAFIASTFDLAHLMPWGSHPLLDPHYASQRVSFVHEGGRFSRLAKVRDIARTPHGLASLRVCPANAPGRLNCGACEKCIRTRLELLAAGIDESPAFGANAMAASQLAGMLAIESAHQIAYYEELLTALRARGHGDLAFVVADKLGRLRSRHGAYAAAGV
jgi:hypothetical protein